MTGTSNDGTMSGGLQWEGPVVWWNPVAGQRHAFGPDRRPHPGEERDTLCGATVTLTDPSDVDWLMPTCDICMSAAVARSDARAERDERRSARGGRWTR